MLLVLFLSNVGYILLFRLTTDAQDFFTSYDEVYDSFDAMGLQENLLRGIYAYGIFNLFCPFLFLYQSLIFKPDVIFSCFLVRINFFIVGSFGPYISFSSVSVQVLRYCVKYAPFSIYHSCFFINFEIGIFLFLPKV